MFQQCVVHGCGVVDRVASSMYVILCIGASVVHT